MHIILQMLIVKDSMVLIHLTKITLLEKSCDYFVNVIIPSLVKEEVVKKVQPDSAVINELISKKKIKIKNVKNIHFINKVNEVNIFGGEAEVVALYWQENADYMATDDDNVRKRGLLLNLKIIGTPSIMFSLYKKGIINKEKIIKSINGLREIGWFSNIVLDKIMIEVNHEY